MQIVDKITITNFRSIDEATIGPFGHFTALAGLNNSGKSNVLRALNAFFNGVVENDAPLVVDTDFFRPRLRSKKQKRISIAVKFALPDNFNFRQGDDELQRFLGSRGFEICKEWTRASGTPAYFLNGGPALGLEGRAFVDQFLSRIKFRYIPNRVLPLDIIRSEHQALRDVIIRRLSKATSKHQPAFKELRDVSSSLVRAINSEIRAASPDIGEVRLATPTTWQDMIFAFGYKLATGDVEIDDAGQGSGVQSMLMFQTLALIDRDYFKRFGWKQAAIWAVEEPESSLHSKLEARVAGYIADIAGVPDGRLQVFATTHSDLFLQFADSTVFVTKKSSSSEFTDTKDKFAVLEQAATSGITRWVHPILLNPTTALLLVEGASDCEFVSQALRILGLGQTIHTTFLGQLKNGPASGGVDDLLAYVKASANALKSRPREAGVFVLLDWDTRSRAKEFAKYVGDGHVFDWPDTSFNPALGKEFRGLERHLSDRIVKEADEIAEVLGWKKNSRPTLAKENAEAFKSAVLKVLRKGIVHADLAHSESFLGQMVASVDSATH